MGESTRAMPVRVGADLAKSVIQVHGVDGAGRRVAAKALRREQFLGWCKQLPPGCIVAMEACSSAHHWARKLRALGLDARLIAATCGGVRTTSVYVPNGRGLEEDHYQYKLRWLARLKAHVAATRALAHLARTG